MIGCNKINRDKSIKSSTLSVTDFVRQGLRRTQCQQPWGNERRHTPAESSWVMAVLYLARGETEQPRPAASKTT